MPLAKLLSRRAPWRLTALVGLCLGAPAAAVAAGPKAEVLSASRGCNTGNGWARQEGSSPAQMLLECEYDGSYAQWQSMSSVQAMTTGPDEDGTGAWAVVQTRVVGHFGQAAGYAAVQYALGVQPFATVPFAPPTLPVVLNIVGSAELGTGASASASVSVNGGALLADQWSTPGSPSVDEHWSIDMRPGQTVQIGKSVSCTTRLASSIVPTSVGCSIGIDPVPSFDQARFDATWGAATFDLASHYRFDAGLQSPVPEPGRRTLAVLGVLLLAGWLRGRVGADRWLQRPG